MVCGQLAALCGRNLLFTLEIQVKIEIKENHKLQNSYYSNQTELCSTTLVLQPCHIDAWLLTRAHTHITV